MKKIFLIATGGTVEAIIDLIEQLGGEVVFNIFFEAADPGALPDQSSTAHESGQHEHAAV